MWNLRLLLILLYDLGTDTGWAHLLNDDEAKFKEDYVRLIGLMEKMFEVE